MCTAGKRLVWNFVYYTLQFYYLYDISNLIGAFFFVTHNSTVLSIYCLLLLIYGPFIIIVNFWGVEYICPCHVTRCQKKTSSSEAHVYPWPWSLLLCHKFKEILHAYRWLALINFQMKNLRSHASISWIIRNPPWIQPRGGVSSKWKTSVFIAIEICLTDSSGVQDLQIAPLRSHHRSYSFFFLQQNFQQNLTLPEIKAQKVLYTVPLKSLDTLLIPWFSSILAIFFTVEQDWRHTTIK